MQKYGIYALTINGFARYRVNRIIEQMNHIRMKRLPPHESACRNSSSGYSSTAAYVYDFRIYSTQIFQQ